MRTTYGVRVSGCSGTETFWCPRRGTADRIRRVLRAYLARPPGLAWDGGGTLAALTHLAADMPGRRTETILAAFDARRAGERCE